MIAQNDIPDRTVEMLPEDDCRRWWLRVLHPARVVSCPDCEVCLPDDKFEALLHGGRVRCANCGRWMDARTGTALCGVHASWAQLYLIAEVRRLRELPGFSCTDRALAAWAGLSTDTIRRLTVRLQEVGQ